MKLFLIAMLALGLSACASANPIPENIKKSVAEIPVGELPRMSSLEQRHCPKSKYPSAIQRNECKLEVRREIAARKMMEKEE